ncbi:GNAT family N-acetyltransferase [Nocardia uniformis]|uniref:GNAT family N-acetyltransferase n=1 Tax=Nocardia uniformis TaxID=53432 RepID=A0A849C890_9NOCA|nr:GNAT family N-acetyltransferase [Nocardia uniformis]NNH72107.1 GNAT family N-acetyltransferase [Nocardia uniformis]
MGTDVTIRPATAVDAEAVGRIWWSGWQDGHLGKVPDELVAVRTEESFGARAVERIADTTVTVVADTVAGFVMVNGSEVEQVYVSRDYRGSGVADLLLTAAERQVAAGGHARAWLAVVPGNARARRFYERSGWIDDGPFDYSASNADGAIAVPCHRYIKQVRA